MQTRAQAILELRQRKQKQSSKTVKRITPLEVIEWIESEFYIPETNQAIKLIDYQREVILKCLAVDDAGLFSYSTVLYSDLKKSAKSAISAAVALCLAWHYPYETVRIVANDIKQANSRTFTYITRAIELNPRLKDVCKINNYHIELPNRTVIDAIPVDPKGEAGGGDLITCFTELWAYKNEASKRLWVETALSPLKFGKSIRWCESYAGYTGESPILEQLYESGVKNGLRIDSELELYTNGRQISLWNTTPRCPWQTQEYYAHEVTQYAPSEFDRIHKNVWASALSKFVPDEWWIACKTEIPEMRSSQACVLVADAAINNDCFGLELWSGEAGNKAVLRYSRAWKPVKGQKLEYVNLDNPDDVDYPEGEMRRLNRENNIVEFAYDPYQLHDMANRIRREVGINTFAFNQGEERAFADKSFFDMIRERRIMHSGDSDMTEHINNANQKSEGEKKLRIVKRADHLKIDLAVCGSMGAYRIIKLNL